jgi:hypothetical protein
MLPKIIKVDEWKSVLLNANGTIKFAKNEPLDADKNREITIIQKCVKALFDNADRITSYLESQAFGKIDLGGGVAISFNDFNGVRLAHVRYYDEDNGRATKTGVAFPIAKFKVVMTELMIARDGLLAAAV